MASDLIKHTSDTSFKADVLDADKLVVVDFWATWCGPCRAIAPHLEAIAAAHQDSVQIVKLNIDDHNKTPVQYGVRSIPTLLLFKNGELVDRMVGNPGSQSKIERFITAHA